MQTGTAVGCRASHEQ